MNKLFFTLVTVFFIISSCTNDEESPLPEIKIGDYHYDRDTLIIPVDYEYQFRFYPDVDNQSYLWDFGDNTTSDEKVSTHRYLEKGIYKVNLTVEGNNSTSQNSIIVKVCGTKITSEVNTFESLFIYQLNDLIYVISLEDELDYTYYGSLILRKFQNNTEINKIALFGYDMTGILDLIKIGINENEDFIILGNKISAVDKNGTNIFLSSFYYSNLFDYFETTTNDILITYNSDFFKGYDYEIKYKKLRNDGVEIDEGLLHLNLASEDYCRYANFINEDEYLLLFTNEEYYSRSDEVNTTIKRKSLNDNNEIVTSITDFFGSKIQVTDDGFLIYGFKPSDHVSEFDDYFYISKLNKDLDIQWEKKIRNNEIVEHRKTKVFIQEISNQYLVLFDNQIIIMDLNGEIIDSCILLDIYNAEVAGVSLTNEGNLLVLFNVLNAHFYPQEYPFSIFLQMDTKGNVI